MSIFKKTQGVTMDKMNVLSNVVITADQCRFQLQYSNIELKIEQIPKLLADIIEVYTSAKPTLDAKTLALAEQTTEDGAAIDNPINLSDIPF